MAQEAVERVVVGWWIGEEPVFIDGRGRLCARLDTGKPINAVFRLARLLTLNDPPVVITHVEDYGEGKYGVDAVIGGVEFQICVRTDGDAADACVERTRTVHDTVTEIATTAEYYACGRG